MNRRGKKKAPYAGANYSITNYLDKFKAMVTRILDTLIENAANNSKIVATEIIDDILKGAVRLTIIQRKGNIQSQTKLLSLGKKNFHGYVK